MDPVTTTRQALYARVWTTPINKLAEEFGISGPGLKAICRRHAIPTPRSGYWMKKDFGKPVDQPPLEDVDWMSADTEVTFVKAKSAKPVAAAKPPPAPAAPVPAPQSDISQSTISAEGALDRARELHPLLRDTRKKLQSLTPNGGLVSSAGKGSFTVTVSPEQVTRALDFLSALVQAVETQGWPIARSDKGLQLCPDGETVGFTLKELTDRVRHMLTDSDRQAMARYEERREAATRRGDWFVDMDRPQIPDWDQRPTGRLVLQLDENPMAYAVASGLRRTFSESSSRGLEDQIERIIEALSARAAAAKEIRRLAAEQEARWAEEAAKRKEFERRQRLETKRLEFLQKQFERHEEARRLEAFLARYAASDLRAHLEAESFVEWAQRRLANLESELTPEALAQRLGKTGLMNDASDVSSWMKVE